MAWVRVLVFCKCIATRRSRVGSSKRVPALHHTKPAAGSAGGHSVPQTRTPQPSCAAARLSGLMHAQPHDGASLRYDSTSSDALAALLPSPKNSPLPCGRGDDARRGVGERPSSLISSSTTSTGQHGDCPVYPCLRSSDGVRYWLRHCIRQAGRQRRGRRPVPVPAAPSSVPWSPYSSRHCRAR